MSAAAKTEKAILDQRLESQESFSSGETLSPEKTKSSSKTKGSERARANGQPTIAPVANKIVEASVRRLSEREDGFMAKEYANMFAYIANDDGRNAKIMLRQGG